MNNFLVVYFTGGAQSICPARAMSLLMADPACEIITSEATGEILWMRER